MADVLTAGAPTVIGASRRPITQGRAPPLVRPRGRPAESLPCVNTYLGLLLSRDAGFGLRIGIGPCLLHMW
jgi:hypothetical protein